jgi:hypothetical protein
MAKKPAPREAMFDAFEQQSPAKNEAVAMLEAVSSRIERAKNPLMRGVSEFELDELADILRRGANPSVEFEPDLAVMAMKAAETSRLACRAAMELLEPHFAALRQRRR